MNPRVLAVGTAVGVAAVALATLLPVGTADSLVLAAEAVPATSVPDGHPPVPTPVDGGDEAGRDLLAAAFGGPARPVVGRVAVVLMDPDGPFVSELDVRATPTGEMVVGRSDAWVVGRDGEDAYLARDGTLLRLGTPEEGTGSPELLLDNYDAHHAGPALLRTGSASVLDLFDEEGRRRERLFLDDYTGVVVRRETYGPRGNARRLVAYTELTVVEPRDDVRSSTRAARGAALADLGPVQGLSADSLETLGRTGWHVPETLPGGYVLSRGYAIGNGPQDSSLHLVYTDGLYSTSLYEQRGGLDSDALVGAVHTRYRDLHVWRWPGAQPERVTWSAQGMTFTAVGDATVEQVLDSLAELPNDPPDDLGDRIRRGVRRVVSWLNPLA